MGNTKRIAVIVRDRQGEALRVAGGLTLADDTVDVIILNGKLNKSNPEVGQPLKLVKELDLTVYSMGPGNGFAGITPEETAKKLLEYDIVVPY